MNTEETIKILEAKLAAAIDERNVSQVALEQASSERAELIGVIEQRDADLHKSAQHNQRLKRDLDTLRIELAAALDDDQGTVFACDSDHCQRDVHRHVVIGESVFCTECGRQVFTRMDATMASAIIRQAYNG